MFKREDRTVNQRYDATQVLTWKSKHVELIESWGIVKGVVTLFGRTWESYDNWLLVRLFNWLENRWLKKQDELWETDMMDEFEFEYGRNE